MTIGTVKWFDAQKGFGFISGDQGDDLFVHQSSVVATEAGPLREGQPVEFEIGEGPKGPQALSVRAVGPPPPPVRTRPEDRPFSSPHRDGGRREFRKPRDR